MQVLYQDITLSSSEVQEQKNGAVVGNLVTIDDDASQSHKYSLTNDAGGRFVVVGSEIRVSSSANLDYETATQYKITVTSTDNGSPAKSIAKDFVIKVVDVNEKPTLVSLGNNRVPENKGAGTVIGTLSTKDPDNSKKIRQTFTYTLLDSANGRFRLDGDVVKVAASNVRCLANGGNDCLLNFETKKEYSVIVRATDNGSPALSVDYTIKIVLTDVNDKPRSLRLSYNKVKENSAAGTVVGLFSASDEDGDTITFTLTNNGGGMFKIVGNRLLVAKVPNYEIAQAYKVTVRAKDNGRPSLSVSSVPVYLSVVPLLGHPCGICIF